MLEKIVVGGKYVNSNNVHVVVVFTTDKNVFFEIEDGDTAGTTPISFALRYWSELPREEEKWFKVIYFHKKNQRPARMKNLFKSQEDFLNYTDFKKEDYHWISLKEFKVE